ncbi:DHA2 family multidrug resistance protein-like MFS transporter [Stackebrandtia albiflava]|uniref:DHA2 family multidrug resistance protein-like MFS transporter n=1 Tax=Stackebrandtia albiflava TaxID=406432 RepID=A0A562VA43_9ACTN|nr:MFS transporter [Stackebrandtia albiflava]TWJ14742.1 DHA2 family multidrug resistance protein-like MFS transporter [Stackebrandtia albiflava]
MTRVDEGVRATGKTWLGLVVLLLPALLISMDLSVLFVAGPAITQALQPTATQWLWMMDVYGFVLAGMLVTMGSLGDRIGRRRLLLIGAAVFGAASLLTSLATEPATLIAARALLGLGGATLAPATFALIREMFRDDAQRRVAIGAWTIAFSGGAVAGPIVGGLLLAHFWWGAVFLVNVPVMVLLLVAAPLTVPEARATGRARFDLAGAALSLAGVLGVVYGMKHLATDGFGTVAVGALLAGAAGLTGFVLRQRRAAHPLIDMSLFRDPAFGGAVTANAVVSFATAGLGLLAFTFMQTVHGATPLEAALWALPTFAGTILGAVAAGAVTDRLPAAVPVPAGMVIAALGFAAIATITPEAPVWRLVAGYTLLAVGIGVTGTVANSVVLTSAPADRAGAASGVSETSTELGAALGIAVLGTVATGVYTGRMTGHDGAGTVAEAVATAETLPGRAADTLRDAAFAAYTSGVTTAAATGAVLVVALAVLVTVLMRRSRR